MYFGAIENLRKDLRMNRHNQNSSKRDKKGWSTRRFEVTERYYNSLVWSGVRFKLVKHEFLGKKYETLPRNWSKNKLSNKNVKHAKNVNNPKLRSKFIDIICNSPINEWLRTPYKWQAPIILYDCHTKLGLNWE